MKRTTAVVAAQMAAVTVIAAEAERKLSSPRLACAADEECYAPDPTELLACDVGADCSATAPAQPLARTCCAISSKYAVKSARSCSGSCRTASSVEPARSAKSTVTSLRSSAGLTELPGFHGGVDPRAQHVEAAFMSGRGERAAGGHGDLV